MSIAGAFGSLICPEGGNLTPALGWVISHHMGGGGGGGRHKRPSETKIEVEIATKIALKLACVNGPLGVHVSQ